MDRKTASMSSSFMGVGLGGGVRRECDPQKIAATTSSSTPRNPMRNTVPRDRRVSWYPRSRITMLHASTEAVWLSVAGGQQHCFQGHELPWLASGRAGRGMRRRGRRAHQRWSPRKAGGIRVLSPQSRVPQIACGTDAGCFYYVRDRS